MAEIDQSWRKLPVIRDDSLILTDTSKRPVPGTEAPCLLCEKMMEVRPYVGDADQICPACFETYRDCAVVVCARCKVVICRLMPKRLDSGYAIQQRSVLHSSACNICSPGLSKSSIIEIELWQNQRRQPKTLMGYGRSTVRRRQ